jgi:hypothetical protein
MILHQSGNSVHFLVKILGSPMNQALKVSFFGLVIACSVVCSAFGSIICNLSSSLASSSSDLHCSGLVSLGSVSCLVLVSVSVSNVSGSLRLVNSHSVLLHWVLVCRLIDSGPD